MELLGLRLELLEAAFGVDVDGIFGVFANIELVFELLRRLYIEKYPSAKKQPMTAWVMDFGPPQADMMMFLAGGAEMEMDEGQHC